MNYTKALENKLIQLFINNNMRVHQDELLKLIPLTSLKSERKRELDKHLKKLCESINKSIKAKIVRDYRFYKIKF